MPKFNQKLTAGQKIRRHPDVTGNFEGGIAFNMDFKTELTTRVLTWMVGEPKFYGDPTSEMARIMGLVQKVSETDPEYLMKLASYARNEMNLRSAPVFLLVESAKYDSVKPFIKNYTPTIIKRVDEITETLALFIAMHGEIGRGDASLPNSLKKGLALSFRNFDAYQFGKYNRDKDVKLKDVMKLVRPKPRTEEESFLFKQILTDTLPTPETWEVVISGNKPSKESWESVIPKMGYFAKIRNLRNFLKHGVNIDPVIEHIIRDTAIVNSRMFPFRYYTAFKTLASTAEPKNPFELKLVLGALDMALEKSIQNVPRMPGKTFIDIDNSRSMNQKVSDKSVISLKEIANLMGVVGSIVCEESVIALFAHTIKVMSIPRNEPMLTTVSRHYNCDVGTATYAHKTIEYLRINEILVDRIMLFSDMQCYTTTKDGNDHKILQEELTLYKRQVNPNVYLYSFDLGGYGTAQFPKDENRMVLLSGFNASVFNFINQFEKEGKTQMDAISKYIPLHYPILNQMPNDTRESES